MQIFSLPSPSLGVQGVKEILYKKVDSKTVIFLSGGSTPKPLYEMLTNEEIIKPAAAGMVDERFGHKWHEKSNERMIKETGLLRYFEYINIPWYPILAPVILNEAKNPLTTEQEILRLKPQDDNLSLERTASLYDQKVRELLFHFPKSIAVLGIGADGHTAGIPAVNLKQSIRGQKSASDLFESDDLVVSYEDKTGKYGSRITMTFTALSMVDNLIILAFGKDKKNALKKMFLGGSLEEIPARLYNKTEISKKTMLFTDQIL